MNTDPSRRTLSNTTQCLASVCEEAAELFCIQLSEEAVGAFFKKSLEIHLHLQSFDGYSGLEILLLSPTDLQVLIRWQDLPLFERHLLQILHSCPIRDWLGVASRISHQPTISTTHRPPSAGDGKPAQANTGNPISSLP